MGEKFCRLKIIGRLLHRCSATFATLFLPFCYNSYYICCFVFRNVGAASAAMHKPAVSLADSIDLRYLELEICTTLCADSVVAGVLRGAVFINSFTPAAAASRCQILLLTDRCLKIKCNVFVIVRVNCLSSVVNYNQTHSNIEDVQTMSKLL